MIDRSHIAWRGAPSALASALLFGASTPLAKALLDNTSPWMLAGLLYLGSGVGLAALEFGRRLFGGASTESPLRRADLKWLALATISGGMVGPVLLMAGLAVTKASTAALLLNLEGLATMVIAWIVFRENVDRRLLLGAFAILAGAVLLSWQAGAAGLGFGALAIAGACLAWGIDNNLTRKISGSSPIQIAMVKGIVAGTVNVALALWMGAKLTGWFTIGAAGTIGFFGYGISLVLFVLGLRHLGTARASAYFSTAPFIGAAIAIAMFHEPLTIRLLIAALLMGTGLYLHLTEVHHHEHAHDAIEHEHRHVHDEHHRHAHAADDPKGEPHTHWHRHPPMIHAHPHYPDLHHRHGH